jgi:hypothetical protein
MVRYMNRSRFYLTYFITEIKSPSNNNTVYRVTKYKK